VIVGIRHAEVLNPDGVVYARLPGFHLSEQGRSEAMDLADALATASLTAVHASPLERAMETAAILAAPQGLAVRPDERLLEWSFWVGWQGLPWSRIRERDPDLLRVYADDPAKASPEDTLEDAGRRVLAWADDAERGTPQGLVIGVTHEAPLIAAMLLGAGRSLGEYHSANLPHLAAVRLLPGPPEPVDLVQWARTC
jgi:broad specificity phosphatase PhoE